MRPAGFGPFRAGIEWLVLLALVLGYRAVEGQTTTGRITGTIRDPAGSVVPGVTVTVTELDSGRQRTVESDEEIGAYSFPALAAGTYRLSAARPGFRTFATDALRLEIGQVMRLDVTLELGRIEQTIDVTADAALLQTDSTEVGLHIGPEETTSLPVNGRNFLPLTFLAPGVVHTSPAGFAIGQRTGTAQPNINGNRERANNFQLDGVDNNQTTDNLTSYLPSPDAIQEIQVITNTAPAEFGNYQGGIINVILKSGTNQLRGTLFEFFRHDALTATNWARLRWARRDPLNPLEPRRRHHDFGGTLGGPLLKNRLFFFGDYQATRRRIGEFRSLVSLIPTTMRQGDFSTLLSGPAAQQLYDPLTTRPDPTNPDQLVRDPFPDNQIPLDRISPVAATLFASRYYPAPAFVGLTENALSESRNLADNDQLDVKIDARLTARDDFSARYAWGLQRNRERNNLAILMGSTDRSPFQAAVLHWTRQMGPGAANEARVGFNRIVLELDSGVDVGQAGNLGEALGIPGANGSGPGLPAIGFSDAASELGRTKVVQDSANNTFQFQDNLFWQRGHHGLKTGLLILRYQQNVYFSGNTGQMGVFDFNGQYTRDLNDPDSFGSPVADFFLGYPSRLARGDFAGTWGHRSTLWAGFVQDDWRASDQVTLNLGLRYEYRTPFVEVHDRQVNFDLETGRPLFAGRDGNSRGLFKAYKYDWQPRLGVAWTPPGLRSRLVLRGAYTVSSFLEGTGTNLRLTLNPPFFNEFETINDPAIPGAPISDGFATLREKDPLAGTILRAWDPKHRPARSQQWNLTGEYQVAPHTAVSVGYVGQDGTHLVVPVNFNQRPAAGAPRPFDHLYPQIAAVILTTPNANQRYDALQVHARKRFSGGWSAVASYTWSSARSHGRGFFGESGQTASPQAFWPNPRDRDADWGPTPFDVRHILTLAGVWDLPWGRDRRWLSRAPAWLNAITGGWTMAGLFRAYSGFAITITAPDQSQTQARAGRPDLVGDPEGSREVGPGHYWFNTAAFKLPARGTFGNAGVGVVRGPGLRVLDVAARKRLRLAGRATLEVRAEIYNLFNTPVFHAPDRSLTSRTFGQVLNSQLEREVQLGVKLLF